MMFEFKGNMNPDVSADIHPPTDSNAAHHQGDRKLFCSALQYEYC